MPTLDELLNSSNEVATCTVNPDTREIIVPEKYKILGVFSDEKVTKIPFTCPKVVGNNVDLTEYNLYINYQNAIGRHNAYLVDDVAVSGDNITFSWLLSRDVTLSSGVVKYSICAKKLNGDSISNEWNTTIANGVVIQGLEATRAIVEENSDIIEAILSKAHTHANKSVLDKFAEADGKPTYDGKALGGGTGGADWAKNDPNDNGYVKNRPGGYLTDPVITDADAFTITSAEGEDGTYYIAMVAVESSAITLSDYAIGDGVIVDFGGKSYSLTWQLAEGMPACGATVTGEAPDWSSAPFCIIAAFGENGSLQAYYVYLQNSVTSPIQVKIKKAKQTPVKIPMKYLESDVYIVKVTGLSNEQRPGVDGSDVSYDVTVSATYDDIVAAINAGKIPILLGESVLRDPMLCLVDISTDDVDGALPYLTFGGTYFGDPDRLYGTCVVIYRTGKATYSWYDSSFVNRLKGVDSAMSSTSLNPVQNWVIKKYVDDHVAGSLSLGLKSATVGQIAKITAVDESGAPTAWSPVNIPVVPTADISANTSARHSHTNKDVLDSITAADKTKLNSVENGATKTIVDTAMSDTSTNPVQNKVIKKYIDDHSAGSSSGGSGSSNILTSPVMICKPGEEGNAGIYLSTIDTGENQAEIKLEDANENSAVAIANLRTPTGANASDYAATKGYVDSKVPTALKNPNALTIKIGSTTVIYDGSTAQTVTIADGSEVAY